MNLKDLAITLLDKHDARKHLYLTEKEENLTELNIHLLNNYAVDQSNVRIYALHADGIGNINFEMFTLIFADAPLVEKLPPHVSSYTVNPDTMEITFRVVA